MTEVIIRHLTKCANAQVSKPTRELSFTPPTFFFSTSGRSRCRFGLPYLPCVSPAIISPCCLHAA